MIETVINNTNPVNPNTATVIFTLHSRSHFLPLDHDITFCIYIARAAVAFEVVQSASVGQLLYRIANLDQRSSVAVL